VCVAIPSRVTRLCGMTVTVECFGIEREVSVALMGEPIAVGDYVLVRSGRHAIERIDRDRALDVLSVMEQFLTTIEAEAASEQRLGGATTGRGA